jgi:hypothetical protein
MRRRPWRRGGRSPRRRRRCGCCAPRCCKAPTIFTPALDDLNAVLDADPNNAQAWLTRATVQTVRGDYAGATASCAHVSACRLQLVTITCIANVGAVTGRALKSEHCST